MVRSLDEGAVRPRGTPCTESSAASSSPSRPSLACSSWSRWAGSCTCGKAPRAASFSVAKSVTSALVGIVLDRGQIRSLDDAISDYVPELIGSGYEGVAIHDVLTMSSGIAFDEDYARFGRLYLNEGRRDDVQVVPAAWVAASVRPGAIPMPPAAGFGAGFGYGYQWWVPDGDEGDFLAMGIWGQFVYVHPGHRVVIVKTSTDPNFAGRDRETVAAFRAIAAAVGGRTP